MAKRMFIVLCLTVMASVFCYASPPDNVPSHYAQLYVFLEQIIDAQLSKTANTAVAEAPFRPVYSFWQPLDIKFMRMVFGMAEEEKISLVSFFWSGCFFCYLNYSPELENLPYRDLIRRNNQRVFKNMLEGKLSPVGKFFQKMATER